MRLASLGFLLLACGCVTVPRLGRLTGRFERQLELAKQAQSIEASQPQVAAQRYQQILDQTVIYKPVADYQKQFGTELSQIGTADMTSSLNEDSVMALPHVYDWAVESVARARLGLARLALTRSDLVEAQKETDRALDLLNKRASSPLLRARLDVDAYELLRQVYRKQGKTGRERLAELNRDLTKEYLGSPAARTDEEEDRRQLEEDLATIKTVDEYTSTANRQRSTQLSNALAQAAGSMSQAMGNLQQMQINSALARSGGRVTPQIRQMQMNQQVANFQRQILSFNPSFAAGVASMRALSPFSNFTAAQQLVNPSYGVNAPQLIKTFASSLADATGSDSMRQAARQVSDSVDGVVSARGGGTQLLDAALGRFTESFGSFQSQAEGITAALPR